MSKALRGDFERLRDRGVASTLTQPASPPTPLHDVEAPPDEAAEEADPGVGDVARIGLFDRLLGRS